MSETKLPDSKTIDLDKALSFTWPEGIYEAAAVLDFIEGDEEKLAFVKALSRTIQ